MGNTAEKVGGALTEQTAKAYRAEYNALLKKAEKECPPPEQSPPEKRKQGPLKRTSARNLLERLLKYQDDVLRFMENASVPFTNNAGERDIRRGVAVIPRYCWRRPCRQLRLGK